MTMLLVLSAWPAQSDEPSRRLRLRDVPADRILAWIPLPHGPDARIEKGVVVVFKRKESGGLP